MLTGLKTYIIAIIAVASAILAFFAGQLDLLQTFQAVGLALGLGGNRAVIAARETIQAIRRGADPQVRILVTYLGTAVTILTALLAGINGQQDAIVTISAILGALGLNFLGLGAKKLAAQPV